MLTYSFEHTDGDSLYIHLYKCIRADILSGALKPDTRLPSKRGFSKHLGVSTITVENAYAQLQSEGFVYSQPKRGFFVAAVEPMCVSATEETESEPAAAIPNTEDSPIRFDLVTGRCPDTFPFSLWAKLTRETLSQQRDQLLSPSPAGGLPVLRQAIAAHLKAFRNMDVRPEQIIVGAGTEYLYSLLVQLLGSDRVYAVENPGYRKIPQIYRSHGARCICIPMDEMGISVSQLEAQGADVAHISPSHHFPTGLVTPIGRRYELLSWACSRSRRYIIEDDYDSEFRLSGKPIPTLQSIDTAGRVIYMNTFTKTLSPTIRISYMVLPQPLLREFDRRLGFYSCTVSSFEQTTLAQFIAQGHFERHLNRMRTHYREVRDLFLHRLRTTPVWPLCRLFGEDSGLHFLLEVTSGLSDEALIKQAEQAHLRLSCLSQYYLSGGADAPRHVVVVNYSGLSKGDAPAAAELLSQCLLHR